MALENEKDIIQLKNRLQDLADRAYVQNLYTFTGFLGLGEQDVFWQQESKLRYAGYTLDGGFESAERVVIRFGNGEELGYEVPFPIVCVHIVPLSVKLAEALSHRDFLGALMNLGVDRNTMGDIKAGEKEAYLFCLDSIAGFICENLSQVRHTHVKCEVTDTCQMTLQEEPELVTVQVQSLRVDAVLAKVYSLSREKSLDLFRAGKVFVGGRLCENNSRLLKPGETVNARGYGKFTLQGEPRETKKGKLSVETAVYR